MGWKRNGRRTRAVTEARTCGPSKREFSGRQVVWSQSCQVDIVVKCS